LRIATGSAHTAENHWLEKEPFTSRNYTGEGF